MQPTLRGNRVAVEPLKKSKKDSGDFLATMDTEVFAGVIRALGPNVPSDLKVGQKVYFFTNLQRANVDGTQYMVMEESNIYAVSGEETPAQQ